MDKKFLAILGVIILGFVGFLIIDKKESTDTNSSDSITAGVSNHSIGNSSKNITLTEYADFQCPACGGFYPIVRQVHEKYADQIVFTFRNFPLDSIHPNARAAHRAAEAAGRQGKFFEMHNLIYENQQSWSNSSNIKALLEEYARQLELDIEKYNSDFISEEVNGIINADIKEGQNRGVNATPTFFLNDTQLNSNELLSVEQFSEIIDAEIAKSTASQSPADSANPGQ